MLVDNWARAKLAVYGGGVLRCAPTPRIDKFASEDPARLTSKSGARHARHIRLTAPNPTQSIGRSRQITSNIWAGRPILAAEA